MDSNERLEGKLLIAQGGGPTAVINQSLVGAVIEARKFPQVTRVLGSLHGVAGIKNQDFLDLTEATTHNLEAVAQTPSSALLSTRDNPDGPYCAEIFRVCQAHDVRYLFYIGGNDSAETCRTVNQAADEAGYQLRVIHIPKTIDNDLKVTDHSPGYGSAAKFVAQGFMIANLDNRALPGVYIGVAMGRHAGFLTAAAALGRKYEDDGPHLIYLPERPFKPEQFIQDVRQAFERYGRCIVAASEGIVDAGGKLIAAYASGDTDPFGNPQLSGIGSLGDLLAQWVKSAEITKRVRADTLGYLQRGFPGCVSEIDQAEAREVGEKAAHFALWHNIDGSVSIRRTGDYSVGYQLVPLENVAKYSSNMDAKATELGLPSFINDVGNSVTPAFVDYARPLVGPLPLVERLSAPAVDKISLQ